MLVGMPRDSRLVTPCYAVVKPDTWSDPGCLGSNTAPAAKSFTKISLCDSPL
jgi:hypothetical protein